jgi:hypothetical protein
MLKSGQMGCDVRAYLGDWFAMKLLTCEKIHGYQWPARSFFPSEAMQDDHRTTCCQEAHFFRPRKQLWPYEEGTHNEPPDLQGRRHNCAQQVVFCYHLHESDTPAQLEYNWSKDMSVCI